MSDVQDEIKEHQDNRYVSMTEATWHFQGHVMNQQFPPVIRLELHLEDQETIIFDDSDQIIDLQGKVKQTKLKAWFELNKFDKDARKHLYQDIPKYYCWIDSQRKWSKRKYGKVSQMIGRIYFVSPSDFEKYNMRTLIIHTPGATCYQDLKTVNGKVCESFQEAAIERGLLSDDKNHHAALVEAYTFTTDISELRSLFAMILVLGNTSNPGKLWEEHKINMAYDIIRSQRIKLGIPDLKFNQEIQDITLYHLNEILNSYNKTISCYNGIPAITPGFTINHVIDKFQNQPLIRSHLAYDKEALGKFSDECIQKFNRGSFCFIFNLILPILINNYSIINN